MNSFKTLFAAVILTLVFASAALSDCPNPGVMGAPPCTSAQIAPDDPVVTAQPGLSSISNSPDVVEISVTTVNVLLSVVSLF